jgi:hypothetical protein
MLDFGGVIRCSPTWIQIFIFLLYLSPKKGIPKLDSSSRPSPQVDTALDPLGPMSARWRGAYHRGGSSVVDMSKMYLVDMSKMYLFLMGFHIAYHGIYWIIMVYQYHGMYDVNGKNLAIYRTIIEWDWRGISSGMGSWEISSSSNKARPRIFTGHVPWFPEGCPGNRPTAWMPLTKGGAVEVEIDIVWPISLWFDS